MANSRDRIIELLMCPIDWGDVTGLKNGDHRWVLADWVYCVGRHSVDGREQSIAREINQGLMLLDDATGDEDAVRRNIEAHIDKMIEDYLLRSGRLSYYANFPDYKSGRRSAFVFQSSRANSKHAGHSLKRETVLERSGSKSSRFFKEFSSQELSLAFWSWFTEYFSWNEDNGISGEQLMTGVGLHKPHPALRLWQKILDGHQFRTAFNMGREIGASRGQPTSHLCCDVDLSSRQVHGYPISPAEARVIEPDRLVCLDLF